MKIKTVFVWCVLMYVCTSLLGKAQGVWLGQIEPIILWDATIDENQPLIVEMFRGGVVYESIKSQTKLGGMLFAKRIYAQYAHQVLPWSKGFIRLAVTGEFDFAKKSPFLMIGPYTTFGRKKNEMVNLSIQACSSLKIWEPSLRVALGIPISISL